MIGLRRKPIGPPCATWVLLFSNSVFGFDFVSAFSGNGGKDYALLFDRVTDDQLISEPNRTRLESVTGEFRTQVDDFAQVYSYSTAGGEDVATLKDREGKKDQLIARPNELRFQAKNKAFYNVAMGFETVFAYATASDRDQAFIYDSPGNDILIAKPLNVSFSLASGESQRIIGFQRTTAYATAGNDTAIFHDSVGDDRFVAKPAHVTMRAANGDYTNRVVGFGSTQAFAAAGGFDTSNMYDSHRVDSVTMNRDVTTMADLLGTYSFESRGFERSYVYGGTKSKDVATVSAVAGEESLTTKSKKIIVRSVDGEFFGRVSGFTHTTTVVESRPSRMAARH